MVGKLRVEFAADHRADHESRQCQQRFSYREARHVREREANEEDVARRVRNEYMSEFQETEGVDEPGHERHKDE